MDTLKTKRDEGQQALEALWKELISHSPKPAQLSDVARLVPYLRERAWSAFCATKPSKGVLMQMLGTDRYQWDHIIELPARQMMEQYPDNDTLSFVIRRAPKLKHEAARKIFVNNPSDRELLWFVLNNTGGDSSLCDAVVEELLKHRLTTAELSNIIGRSTLLPTRQRVADLILDSVYNEMALRAVINVLPNQGSAVWHKFKGQMEGFMLTTIITSVPSCRLEAGRKLLEGVLLFHELFEIVKHVPELRSEAFARLRCLQPEPSEVQWEAIIREAPELENQVRPLIRVPERDAQFIFSEIVSTNHRFQ